MSKLDSIDLMVSDVTSAAEFFVNVAGMTLKFQDPRFAELMTDNFVLMLSPDAMVPLAKAAGIILHFEVSNVPAALQNAVNKGAKVLLDVTTTDWGTESAMVQGPDGIVVDFYRHSSAE